MKINLLISLHVFCALLFYDITAFALVDGQAMIGYRRGSLRGENSSEKWNSSEISLSAHLDPLPLIPVAFGAALLSNTFSDEGDVKDWSGLSIAPEILAWIPLGDLKPYGRLGYTVWSQYRGKFKSQTTPDIAVNMTASGIRVGVGVKYSILPLIAILGEFNYASEAMKVKSAEIGQLDVSQSLGNFSAVTNALLVGIEVGL